MAFRGGRGGGRGGGRFGGGFFRRAKEEAFEPFPEIEGLESAKYVPAKIKDDFKFVAMSQNLQSFFKTSPYYYEDGRERKVQKVDIERYSDRKSKAPWDKQPLWYLIKMDADHMPAELAAGEKRVAKKVRWDNRSGYSRFDALEKLEKKREGEEGKEDEEEDEDEALEEEDDGELSDEGDYVQNVDFDDDEDDFNMVDDNDEAEY